LKLTRSRIDVGADRPREAVEQAEYRDLVLGERDELVEDDRLCGFGEGDVGRDISARPALEWKGGAAQALLVAIFNLKFKRIHA
jgi:hypothetical protein